MQIQSFSLTCDDGHQMPVYNWTATTKPCAIVVICHGMAEYAERYAPIAQVLNQNGLEVFAFDNRGHGNAVKTIADLGMVSDDWFSKQVNDINLVISHIRQNQQGKKIFLLGHSMGSFIAQFYFQAYGKNIDGLILSATNGEADPLLSAGIALAWMQMKIAGPNHRSHIIDKLSFGRFNSAFKPNRTDHDWLSRDEGEVDKYVHDPKCGFTCSARFFYYFFKGIEVVLQEQNISKMSFQIPVYAFAGDKDPVGLEGKGFLELIRKWKSAGIRDISYDLYKNGRHEMLNEINREEVLTNLINWIKKHS